MPCSGDSRAMQMRTASGALSMAFGHQAAPRLNVEEQNYD